MSACVNGDTQTVRDRSSEKVPLRKKLYRKVRGELCSTCKGPEAERASSGDGERMLGGMMKGKSLHRHIKNVPGHLSKW